MNVIEFGEFIRGLRQKAGLTLSKLAEISGVSHPYLSQIENGRLKNLPSIEVIIKLASPLEVHYSKIMDAAGYIPAPEYSFRQLPRAAQSLVDSIYPFIELLEERATENQTMRLGWLKGQLTSMIAIWEADSPPGWEENWYSGFIYDEGDITAPLVGSVEDTKELCLMLDELQRMLGKEATVHALPKDLNDYLNLSDVTYMGTPLSQEDKKRILGMLQLLFPERG